MADLRLGIALWSQASDWSGFLAAAQRAERLGYDHVWTWDHLLAIFGDPDQQIFEGYTALAAVAQATERIRLGLFVGANTFRNPALAVKCLTTIDHISAGRAVMGIGGAWFEGEHRAFGLDFGSGFGQRLDWLGAGAGGPPSLLDGGGGHGPARGRGRAPCRRSLRVRSPAGPAPAGPAAPADDDRRQWRAEDPPDRRGVRRHLERLRDTGDARPEGRDPARALRGRRSGPGKHRAVGRVQDHDSRHGGRSRTRPARD